MAIDHPQVPVCCLSNGYMLGSFPFICFSENFSLCINELRVQSAISSNLTCIFPRVVSAIKIFVVTLQSENKRTTASPPSLPRREGAGRRKQDRHWSAVIPL